MGLTVLDASVAIATLDSGDVFHHAAFREVQRASAGTLVLPASALAESLVAAFRDGSAADAREVLRDLAVTVVPLTDEMAEESARLRARFRSLRLGDALVIATGRVLGADEVLTGDQRMAGVWDRVRVLRAGD